jgi:anti-sigma factor RsiW
MNCKDIDSLIIDFLDGNLTDDEQASVEEHLAACPYHKEEIAVLTDTQDHLREALELLVAGYSPRPDAWERLRQRIVKEEQTKALKPGLMDSILSTIKDAIRNRPLLRRLNWRTGLVALLAISLTVILAVTVPLLVRPDSEVLAIDIALNSPEVQTALGSRSVDQAEVAAVLDAKEDVFISIRARDDYLLIVEVNPSTQEVVELSCLELTNEVRQKVMDIAMTDSRIQDLLEQGAYISSFLLSYYININENIGPGDNTYIKGSVEFRIIIGIKLHEDEYIASVNLEKEEVDYIQGP